MQHWFYLIALVVSISGLLVLDWRYKLAFWHDRKRTGVVLAVAMMVFIIWDLVGIRLGVFFKGSGEYMLPFELLPEFPVEELFFLFLLCYVTLLLFRGFGRWRHTS